MDIDLISTIILYGAIIIPVIGLSIIIISIIKKAKLGNTGRYILVIGSIPAGMVTGFLLFALPADSGWLGTKYQGEAGFSSLLLFTFLWAIALPLIVNKITKKCLSKFT